MIKDQEPQGPENQDKSKLDPDFRFHNSSKQTSESAAVFGVSQHPDAIRIRTWKYRVVSHTGYVASFETRAKAEAHRVFMSRKTQELSAPKFFSRITRLVPLAAILFVGRDKARFEVQVKDEARTRPETLPTQQFF